MNLQPFASAKTCKGDLAFGAAVSSARSTFALSSQQ